MAALPMQPQGGPQPPMQGQPQQPMPQPWQPEPSPDPAPEQPRWAETWKRPAEWTDEMLLAKFNGWDRTDKAHWADWKTDAKLAYDVTAGYQWDKDALADAEEKSLTTVSINKVDSTVSAISGSEMTNKQEVRYYPREVSTKGPDGRRQDIVVNEILTAAAEWVRDECDAADEESDGFRDMLICGLGGTETYMSYENDPDGMTVIERCDPLEFRLDAATRRPNAVDARRVTREKAFSKEEAEDKFGLDEGGQDPTYDRGAHDADIWTAYTKGQGETRSRDDVWITEYQWWELERIYRVLNPMTGKIEELTGEEFKRIIKVAPEFEQNSVSVKIRRYYRAFRCADKLLEVTALPDEEFTYKFMTGKLDRNRGVWYGVVKAMIDPQRLLNKQISQIQRIIDTNAKGGILAETDAFEDWDDAEERWAASDSIIPMKAGSIGGSPKVMPKPISQYPSGLDRLLEIANQAVPGVSGVNDEMLGIIDREQAGVVDVQRKEAAYGTLKPFFNSLRRYRRMHGRHLLKLIQRYMTDGRLIRIVGRQGNVQYLPLVKDPATARYDCIVDEAPTGPNQKDKVFQFLAMFGGPLLSKLNLPPQIMLKFLEFSPLPTSLVAEVMQEVQNMPPQQDPNAIKAQHDMQMGQMKMQMDGQKAQFDSNLAMQQAQFNAQMQQSQAAAELQLEQAKNNADIANQNRVAQMQAETDRQAAQQKIAIESQKADILAELESMKTEALMQVAQQKADSEAQLKLMQLNFEMKMQEREQAFNEQLAEKQAAHDQKIEAKKASTRLGGEVG